ncbi:caspase family protein [Paludisphaera mucosa]|uniref:Caspase family protein n=1 Tax=Paludisphaera mucosa TaxID=3030827 RepID=A0ABT6FDX0_9BACT|nr:caspase family protein [Paludisphaera mucosa]MDG3005780.1 caspase family protein [Paludisphaera mucosa]
MTTPRDRLPARRTKILALLIGWLAVAAARAQAPDPPPRKPQLWAMLVGIERYEDSTVFPRCRGAAADAAALGRWLIDAAGWPADHVLLLSDHEAEDLGFAEPARRPERRPATRAELDRGVREWLAGKARPGDTILIFFAGQAVGLPARAGDHATRSDRDLLLPMDARGVDVEATGWRLGDAIEGLAATGDYSIVGLLDTSPAGRVQSPRPLGNPARFEPGERMLRGIVRWPGVTAWLAAGDKPSGQDPRDGGGFLTKGLLESLGTRTDPAGLAACLDRLRRRPELAAQRFRASGGFRPDLSLWPSDVRPPRPKAEPILQRGHADRVTAVAFSGDGGRLFTAGLDSTVRIWDVADARLGRVLPHALNGVWSLAQSPDGRMLAAGGGKGEVFAYDLIDEEVVTTGRAALHRGPVERTAFLPTPADAERGSRRLVSIDNKGGCLVWDLARRRMRLAVAVAESKARLLAVAARPGSVAFALVVPDRNGVERIQAFDASGKLIASLPAASPRPTALALADDGAIAYLGREDGTVSEIALPGGATRSRAKLDGAVTAIQPCPSWLIATAGRKACVVPQGEEAVTELVLDRTIGRTAVSADGRLVAVCDAFRGELRVWELTADGAIARPIPLDLKEAGAALSLAFAAGGETLASGDGAGGIRLWEIPAGRTKVGVAAARGRVRHVAVSADERALLQVGDGGEALLWEFGEGRGARRIPGASGFRPTGEFLPNGDLALIDGEGLVVVHDRATLARKPIAFEKPRTEDGAAASSWGFHRLAVAADRRIAAGSRDGPLACVWKSEDGALVGKPIRGHDDAINVVAFANAGAELLTGSDDGLVKLWSLADREPKLLQTLGTDDAGGRSPVTSLAASPKIVREVVAGLQDGRVQLWRPGAVEPVDAIARLSGSARTVAYSPDGRLIAAAGDDRRIALIEASRPGVPIPLGTGPSHFEMINALSFWPGGKVLASAGDDAVVRLWRLADRSLIGTLAATAEGLDWVVFTPDGLYDASPVGERRVAWRLDAKDGGDFVARLDQVRRQRHVFDLVERLARAEDVVPPEAIPVGKPPRIELEPVAEVGPKDRRVELAIRLSDPDVEDLRLYHNGVPIPGELKREGREARATVTLVGGENSIYALAGKPGGVDARSNRLDLRFEGRTLGRTHILALGISKYDRQALRYADSDARAIAEFLHANRDEPGADAAEPIVLLNEDVSQRSLGEAFETLRRRVRGRPEDRIVVFLAGHTDVREGFFCLLLPKAQMPAGPEVVAMRGAEPKAVARGGAKGPDPIRDRTLLPYGLIHQNLAAAEALQRLVIVDACQAEALFDDPVVRLKQRRAIRNAAEEDAYPARTSYILASRRGERAGEAERLKHGLLTYTLLRGMGRNDLGPTPDLAMFERRPTADADGDGWVETEELRQYADLTLPTLSQAFPELVLRGAPGPARAAADAVSRDAEQTTSFPLIKTTPPPAAATAP